jgi:uncharacterized membrane protein
MVDMTIEKNNSRIQSIDFLRGLVMIIMALDHVRDYFHSDAYLFSPTDLTQTTGILFFSRWITHFCAPVFVFLSGTSAFLSGRFKSKKDLSVFLLTRGLWLIFLEVTILAFAWFFDPEFHTVILGVIWAIGLSMVFLAGLIHLPFKAILVIGLAIVFGHNAFDDFHVESGFGHIVWAALHDGAFFETGLFFNIMLFYPVLPWAGLMALGYCFGRIYGKEFEATRRKQILFKTGLAATLLFVGLRALNVYGDSQLWTEQSSIGLTILSFLDTSKYPPSLLYLLMTIGPALLLLSFLERLEKPWTKPIIVIGRVPMFYYVLHIYLIHFLAMLAAETTGFGWKSLILTQWVNANPGLKGFGFDLWVVYLIWALVVVALYPLCRRYNNYRTNHREKWWLSYF